jgi:outer membrane protein assembly factor BamB
MLRPLLLAALGLVPLQLAAGQGHWPQWRGPLGSGESPDATPPLKWGEDLNIRWRVALPGRGKGTPIVFGERVYVLAAEGVGEKLAAGDDGGGGRGRMRGIKPEQKQRFLVMALERKDGAVAWQDTAIEMLPHEGTHGDGTWASASAVTDGERLIAFFGSRGIFAYDMSGKRLWEKQLGEMQTRNAFGEGTTPALHGDTVVVQWDHEGPSFIVALDAKTGEEKWRQPRDEQTCWATPVITEVDGKLQVIANGTNRVRGYDLATGKVVWECGGMTTNAIPSPIVQDGVCYVMSGYRGAQLHAIKLSGAKGDISGKENVLWSHDRDTPYVPSGLLADGKLYFFKSNSGVLSSLDIETGEAVFGPERMQTVANVYASPVAAAGHVYVVSRDGETEVLDAGAEYKVLATNTLDDAFDASPALAGRELYLRGEQHLYCIAEPEK